MHFQFLMLGVGTILPFALLPHLSYGSRWWVVTTVAAFTMLALGRGFRRFGIRRWGWLILPLAAASAQWRTSDLQLALDAPPRTTVSARGWVCSKPVASETGRHWTFDFCLEQRLILDKAGVMPEGSVVLVRCYACQSSPQIGESYQAAMRLSARRPLLQQDDWFAWQKVWRFGIWQANVHDWRERPQQAGVRQQLARWREERREVYRQAVDTLVGGELLSAMVMGQGDALSTSQWDGLRKAGLTHLAVVSGLHLAILAGLAFWIGRILARGLREPWIRYLPLLGSAMAVAGYLWLVGFAVPVFRASIMVWGGILLALLRQKWPFWQLYMGAAGITLWVEPLSFVSPGYWLSFSAVAVLGLSVQAVASRSARVLEAVRLQCLLALATLPILASFQGEASVVSPLINLVAVPLVTCLLLPLGFIGLAENLLPDVIHECWRWITGAVLGWFWSLVAEGSDWPMLPFSERSSAVAAGMLLLYFMILYLRQRAFGFWWLLLTVGMIMPGSRQGTADEAVELWMHNVGQGLALTVHQGPEVLIYDSGMAWPGFPSRASQTLLPFLTKRGIASVEKVIISHDDLDHAGGLRDILSSLVVSELITGEPLSGVDRPQEPCLQGQSGWLGKAYFEILWPPPPGSGYLRQESGNNLSCTIMVSYAGRRVLIPGDLEVEAQQALVASFSHKLSADILVVPHHGARSSFHPEFLTLVDPRIALVSAGFRNRFGHPHPLVTGWLQRRGVRVLNTATDGPLRISWGQGRPLTVESVAP